MSITASNTEQRLESQMSWLRRVVAARTGSADAIDEVLAEVALAVASSDAVPSGNDFAPWLCKIAVRQSALYHRKRSRQQQLAARYGQQSESLSQEEDDPIFWLLDQERRDLVQKALSEMSAEARSLLLMKFIEKKTYAQIADHLNVTTHIAEYRLAQAKKRMRALLTGAGLDAEDLS